MARESHGPWQNEVAYTAERMSAAYSSSKSVEVVAVLVGQEQPPPRTWWEWTLVHASPAECCLSVGKYGPWAASYVNGG